ncbi:MAG: FtsL-like putative cell division protein [Flavobacteriales bacterium]|jgi:hypothetical protein|nr:FtsL-like putative cell division protein [Flavobacteriales bacterium]
MKRKKKKTSFLSLLKGDFFSKQQNVKYVPFLFLIVMLLLINIRVSFYAEKLLKRSIKLEYEVADLRLTYITTKSQLMQVYKRSTIENMVVKQGLSTSLIPPYIIDINEE